MNIHFKYKHPMMTIDATFAGTPDEIVLALRNHAATKVPDIGGKLVTIDDKFREALDVDGKGDWTDAQFFAELTKLWNGEEKKKAKRERRQPVVIEIPRTCAEFILACKKIGIATDV